MIFYTRQSQKVVNLLEFNDEVLSNKPNKKDFFYDSYHYMNNQLEKVLKQRSVLNDISQYSIFWGVPSLREMEDMAKGILLVFDIPEDNILISDYMAWHYVLNNIPFIDQKDEKKWDNILKKKKVNSAKLIEKTWSDIFNVSYNSDSKSFNYSDKIKRLYEGKEPILQLCVKSLRKEWLVKIEEK